MEIKSEIFFKKNKKSKKEKKRKRPPRVRDREGTARDLNLEKRDEYV